MADYDENSFTAISEAYKIWKKHSPFLYSLLQTYPLSSCSQSVDWFPEAPLQNDWKTASLLLATNSLTDNSAFLIPVPLPTDDALTDYAAYRD